MQKSIMLVDDNRIALRSLAKALEMHGFPVRQYDCPLAALAAYSEEVHSLIITDYRMPGINGLELVRKIRQRSQTAECLIYTGYPENDLISQCAREGLAWFKKPLVMSQLMSAIEKIYSKNSREEK